jgi:hypothetical protein
MKPRRYWIDGFAERVRRGDTLTLLCSSACADEARCHRTLVKALIEEAARPEAKAPATVVKRRRT